MGRVTRLTLTLMAFLSSTVAFAQVKSYAFKEVTIVPGVTTEAQVRAALGTPKSVNSDGKVTVFEYSIRGGLKIVQPETSVEQPIQAYKILVLDKAGKDDKLGYGFEDLGFYIRFSSDQKLVNVESWRFL